MDVGIRIKKYREKQNISQDELAEKIFVSRQTISNWENSKSYPDIKSLLLLSDIFKVSLDDFMKGDIEKIKKLVNTQKVREFNIIGYIYLAELLILAITAYPLFKLEGNIGVIVWILFFLVTFFTAGIAEKIKKNNNIQTYKEIVAFCEGKTLTHDESLQEMGKKNYQKILLSIISGVITFIVIIIMSLIFGRL